MNLWKRLNRKIVKYERCSGFAIRCFRNIRIFNPVFFIRIANPVITEFRIANPERRGRHHW
jgi:hypothetical protein